MGATLMAAISLAPRGVEGMGSGLDRIYCSKIIKAGALLADTKTLLAHWDETRSMLENLDRFRRENIFGKASRSRVEDILAIFRQRYLASEAVTKTLAALVKGPFPTEGLTRIFYFHAARADALLHDTVKRATERLAEVMYTVLLRELDYAEDYDIADLEIELEKEGKLDEFIARCSTLYNLEWRTVRKGAQKISRASAILHQMDPATYPMPDAWSQSLRNKSADITVGKLVERTFELCTRRRPGKALVFIIDEVGQYVARSADKIEDLRAVVEQFGKVSKNLLKAKKAVAPVWVVVTSQEKLDEVVAALDSKRVELAKLQDRFRYRIDLAPADIREVATRRVLAKKEAAVPVLKKFFGASQGQLNAACRLERTKRTSQISEDDFVQFYPYLPHFVELSIDIMSGIRLQPGAPKHLGGSNRTIIKQAYEMLVSDRIALAAKPIGTLVTLDKIFELVEGNLSSEKQKDISDITRRFKSDLDDQGMAARVAKTICLLEFVRDLPRTETNIAACLVDEVGQPAPLAQVQKALQRLSDAQFIRNTEEGWKLQTAQEKNWETERRGYRAPKPKDRNEIIREALREIFSDPKLKTYRFRDLRNFRVGIQVDGVRVGDDGQVPLSIATADDAEAFPGRLDAIRNESRQETHRNDVYWVFALTQEIDDLVADLHASKEMIRKYTNERNMNRLPPELSPMLDNEVREEGRWKRRLIDKIAEALEQGHGLFQGVSRDAAALGKTAGEIFKKFFDLIIPDLYPKLEMGARPLKGTEAEEILKAANLNGLSQVFYSGDKGLNLVVKEDGKFVPNSAADIVKEVLDYLNREHAYGNKETRTGKVLETHFSGLGYGWDLDVLRLILAVLFRAGSIEVSHGGRRFDSYQDPQSRVPFTNTPAFRSTLFTPARPLDLKTLTQAVRSYEELCGETVDVERNAIATAFKNLVAEEMRLLLPVEARVRANRMPVLNLIEEFRSTLESVRNGGADDCVQILVGEGASLKEARDRIRRIREVTNDRTLTTLDSARRVVSNQWPIVRNQKPELAEVAERLQMSLGAEDFYSRLDHIQADTRAIASAYGARYTDLHGKRLQAYQATIEHLKGRSEWTSVAKDQQEPLLRPLLTRACEHGLSTTNNWPLTRDECDDCRASIAQMESDLAAVEGLKAQAIGRLQELTAPKEGKLERVRLAEFFTEAVESEESVERAVERLREHLLKLVAEGVKIILE
jgi:hypothetical protein